MKNKQNGITLLALVVTIIILLILAGIVITQLTGDNGLFIRAKQAKNNTLDAQNAENITIADYENKIDEVTGSRDINNKYHLTLLWDTKTSSGNVTFLNGHTYDEFDSIRFIYASLLEETRYVEKDCSKELWKMAMESSANSTDTTIGLYGYSDSYIDLYCISNAGFKIKNTNQEWIYKIYGVNY